MSFNIPTTLLKEVLLAHFIAVQTNLERWGDSAQDGIRISGGKNLDTALKCFKTHVLNCCALVPLNITVHSFSTETI